MKRTLAMAFGLIALATATPAVATIVINPDGSATISSGTAVGSSFMVNFDGEENGVVPGLTSSLALTFKGTSGNNYLFDYLLTNTSTTPVTSSVVTAFGFNVDPNAILANSSVNGTFGIVSAGQVSQGYNLEMCFKNGQANNCAGSPGNMGVDLGRAGSGTIALGFSSLSDNVTLSGFLTRYQAVNGNGSAVGLPVAPVPEPATWGMMLLGFIGIGVAMRRGRRKGDLMQIA